MAFVKGQSGNPAGRPPGVGRIGMLRDRIAKHVPEIIDALVESAKKGDVSAAKLLIDRVLPVMRPAGVAAPMPGGVTADAVQRVVSSGDMAPSEGLAMLELQKAARYERNAERTVARGPSKIERDLQALLEGD